MLQAFLFFLFFLKLKDEEENEKSTRADIPKLASMHSKSETDHWPRESTAELLVDLVENHIFQRDDHTPGLMNSETLF